MSTRYIGGLWVMCDDFGESIDDSFQSEKRTVSMFLDMSSLAANHSALSLMSRSPDTIDYIAVATAGRRGGDLERKVSFGPAVALKRPLPIEEVVGTLQPRFAKYATPPNRRVNGIPPASWDALLAAVMRLGGVAENQVDHLKLVMASRLDSGRYPLSPIVEFERDAAAISIETFRGSRSRQRYLSASPASKNAPFIEALEKSGAKILEDRMIDHDLASFPALEAMKRHMIGAATIETDTGTLTILNANRTGVEATLGVDLVYYHHLFDSFVMVQYKRLTGDRNPVFYPDADASFTTEVERMRGFQLVRDSPEQSSLLSYRLDSNPFFLKFCSSLQRGHWSRMLPGIYMPLNLWDRFAASAEARGPRGGLVVSYGNAHRRLNNSDFVKLVRGGWVGSSGSDSAKLNAIVASELAADKSVVAAVHHENRSAEEFLRDSKGRFAAEDDPDAL